MIRGFFDAVSYRQPVPRLEVVVYLPRVSPRRAPVSFLIDTGATHSVLQPATLLTSFEVDEAHLTSPDGWSGQSRVAGVGGMATHFIDRAHFLFMWEDGTARMIDQEVQIAALASQNQSLPSLLGRDVLRHFRLCLDLEAGDVTLEER